MKTVAVILAGGKSSRMGRDKAMLPVNGTPLVAMLAERWRDVFDGLVLSVDTRERFAHLGLEQVQMVEDARPEAGPLAALETVMNTVPAERYFLTAVDLPFGNPELARALSGRMGEADVCLIQRRSRGVEPLFSFYSRKCLPASLWGHTFAPTVADLCPPGSTPLPGRGCPKAGRGGSFPTFGPRQCPVATGRARPFARRSRFGRKMRGSDRQVLPLLSIFLATAGMGHYICNRING